jgi:tetratricopeptide (TPR) repeat protein
MSRLAEAEARFKQRLVYSPHSDMTRVYLASIYGRTGRYDLARETWKEVVAMNPHFSTERLKDSLPYRDPA